MSYDLSRLYINFEKCPAGESLVGHFSELQAYEEFSKCPDESYIKLAILTADEMSPLVTIKERTVMIREAFKIVGLDPEKNKDKFNDIVDYKDVNYMNAWIKYLFIQNEVMFTDWMLANRDYEYFLAQASQPKGDQSDASYLKSRKELRTTISYLGKEKEELEAKLFPESKAARQAAMKESLDKIELYCEKYAQPFNYY